MSIPGPFTNTTGGIIQGTGTLDVSGITFTNAGDINPAGALTGSLSLTGNLTQDPAGSVNIEIGGTVAGTNFDQLNISGSGVLTGTLNITLINGFNPTAGQSFQIMTFTSRTGVFTTVNPLCQYK